MNLDLSAALASFYTIPDDLTIKLKFDSSPFAEINSCSIIYYTKRTTANSGIKIPSCVVDSTTYILTLTEISDTTLIWKILLDFKTDASYPTDKKISAWFYYN